MTAIEFYVFCTWAGFTKEEAQNIFHEVDVDRGGSVSLEEFERWWIESQRQQVRESCHGVMHGAQDRVCAP